MWNLNYDKFGKWMVAGLAIIAANKKQIAFQELADLFPSDCVAGRPAKKILVPALKALCYRVGCDIKKYRRKKEILMALHCFCVQHRRKISSANGKQICAKGTGIFPGLPLCSSGESSSHNDHGSCPKAQKKQSEQVVQPPIVEESFHSKWANSPIVSHLLKNDLPGPVLDVIELLRFVPGSIGFPVFEIEDTFTWNFASDDGREDLGMLLKQVHLRDDIFTLAESFLEDLNVNWGGSPGDGDCFFRSLLCSGHAEGINEEVLYIRLVLSGLFEGIDTPFSQNRSKSLLSVVDSLVNAPNYVGIDSKHQYINRIGWGRADTDIPVLFTNWDTVKAKFLPRIMFRQRLW